MQLWKGYHGRLIVVMLMLALSVSLAFGQTQPPAPVTTSQFRTPALPQTGRFQLMHQLLDFEPGAATPFHTHPGQVVVTVLEGANTFTANGVETVYTAGQSFVEEPGVPVQARNAGSERMSVLATLLLPLGEPSSHPVEGDSTPPPRQTTRDDFKTEVDALAGPFDVAHAILDFAPGAATPYHTHPGVVMVTVLEGQLTFNREGVDQLYNAGDSFVEQPNQVVQARNAGSVPTRVMASYLVPRDAPLSAPHAGPAVPGQLPNTGQAPADAGSAWILVIIALGLIAAGPMLRRMSGWRG